jgi:hypothetical protein
MPAPARKKLKKAIANNSSIIDGPIVDNAQK